MRVDFKVSGLDGVLDMLLTLPPEVVSKAGGPVRSALRAGAVVIRDEARKNVRKIVLEPNVDGKPSRSTGALEKAIKVTRGSRGAEVRSGKAEKYIVWLGSGAVKKYVNNVKNRRSGRASWTGAKEYKTEGPQFYGRLLESGTKYSTRKHDKRGRAIKKGIGGYRMKPHQWMRPAFLSKRQEAVDTITSTLVRRIDLVVKRLSKKK
jgi:HK97 gp10 family phage protein